MLLFAGRFLIPYIKVWQDILNNLNMANFNFNTYIISVLVIFFLQVTQQLALTKDIPSVQAKKMPTLDHFKNIPRQFFDFYGNRYQMWNHVISAHIGQWQEREHKPTQRHFGEAKQQLVLTHRFYPNLFQWLFSNIVCFFCLITDCVMESKHHQIIGQTAPCTRRIWCDRM